MMPFALPQPLVSIPAHRVTIYVALFLCFLAAGAQTVPQGYVATWEGDVIVMRPSETADPGVAIRVYPTIAGSDDPGALVRRWADSHPVAGVDPRTLRIESQRVSGVSAMSRAWKDGARERTEVILMPQTGSGRYQPVLARMPSQPGELMKKHTEAVGYVTALIVLGRFQPNIPADGNTSPAVTAGPVEPAGKRAAPEQSAPARAPSGGTQATTGLLARATAEIETMGFTTRGQAGVGGMWVYVPKPVALFRSGDALLEIGNLNRATSLEADRAAHPADWGRWRRTAGGIEVMQGGQWKKLNYNQTMQRLSPGFALSGKFEHLGGGGNTAFGGDDMLVTQGFFTFQPDGKFSSNRFSGFSSHQDWSDGTQTGVVTQSHGPVVQGRYHVDGYLLRLEPAGGPPETHLIATYPTDPSIIWIDGQGYTLAK